MLSFKYIIVCLAHCCVIYQFTWNFLLPVLVIYLQYWLNSLLTDDVKVVQTGRKGVKLQRIQKEDPEVLPFLLA